MAGGKAGTEPTADNGLRVADLVAGLERVDWPVAFEPGFQPRCGSV